MIRIGAIGHGDIAQRRHFPQLQALAGRAELVAIAGRNRDHLADCAGRFGVPRWYDDPAAMLAEAPVDAVMVLTPPDSHADYAAMAVRAGKHVMVEKPLVRTREEARALAAAVRSQTEPRCFMALPFVETPDHVLVDRLLRQGAIGAVSALECHRGHKGPTHAGWFYSRALAGGGVLADLGIYHLTTVVHLLGPMARGVARLSTRFETRRMDDGSTVRPDVEDSAMLALTSRERVAVSLHAHWNGSVPHTETRARVAIFGREGTIWFGAPDGTVRLHRADGDYRMLPESREEQHDGYAVRSLVPPGSGGAARIVEAFVERIEAGETGPRSLEIQAHVLDIIARAYDSAEGGQPFVPETAF
jgi:predicted dehydrogenase